MTTHKAITIQQPHVAAIFAGLKRFETRSWATKYRGPLLIHAGKAVDGEWRRDDRVSALGPGTSDSVHKARMLIHLTRDNTLGLGCILGVADLVDCHPAADVSSADHHGWGDFTPGRFAFELANPRLFETPIPARGQLGLWTYMGEVEGP